MKVQNLLLFFVVFLVAGGLVWGDKIDIQKKISLEVLDLFPQGKDREFIDIYREIGDSGTVLVAQDEGISDASFQAFLAQVQALPNTKEIITQNSSAQDQDFIAKNYFYLGNFSPLSLSMEEMERRILDGLTQKSLNPIDPLGFIRLPNIKPSLEIQNQPLAIIKLKDSDPKEVVAFYERFSSLAQGFGITHYFSPSFIDAINPQLILDEVNLLGGIALVFFALLYFLILRMPLLTINSILTILTSNLIAILVLLYIYPQVSIMSLSFGIGISNICIDYMMHHHFLGYYLSGKMRFNSSVFYGFITTIVGFFVCLFVPFPLLSQLALYTIINLSVAYLCFAFLYQGIGFSTPKYYPLISRLHFSLISPFFVILLSLGMGGFALSMIQRDLDLSKLDYQNQNFENQRAFFSPLNQKVFLLQASNTNALIKQARVVAEVSPQSVGLLGLLPTSDEIKKRERYFKSPSFTNEKRKFQRVLYRLKKTYPEIGSLLASAYRSIPTPPKPFSQEELLALGIDIAQKVHSGGEELYFQGSIDNLSKLSHLYGIYTKQPQEIMQEITNSVYAPMASILVLAFVAIVILLLVISGKRFFDSLPFVLFPISSILLYLTLLQIPINIMHLFAMLLVVVVGVDYGIYHIKERDDFKSKHAVIFSTLTTLCSFGLFLFSKTKALNSFGEVVSIGMICILVLIFLQRDFARERSVDELHTIKDDSKKSEKIDDMAWLDEVERKTQEEMELSKRLQTSQIKPRSQTPQNLQKEDNETLYF